MSLDRRSFLKVAGVGGLGLAVGCSSEGGWSGGPAASDPWIWIRIGDRGTDHLVTLVIPRCEMGQGTLTGLAMILAEELDVEWSAVGTEWAPPLPRYGRVKTAASDAVRTLWLPLRRTGALARTLLVNSAADTWGVDAAECRTSGGRVVHEASARALGYGELAALAATLPVPEHATLKDPSEFELIGRSLPRLDVPDKVSGAARYGLDVRLPGMLVATVLHAPVLGSRLVDWDPGPAEAVPGVRACVRIEDEQGDGVSAVAVVADGYWSALKGSEALVLTWDDGPNATWHSEGLRQTLLESLRQGGERVLSRGAARRRLKGTPRSVAATYEAPYLAHATLEPMNCTARLQDGRCEVWVPTQSPTEALEAAARASGLREDQVILHQTLLGGGLGRRQSPDYVTEAVKVTAAVGAPVQLIWSREQDMRHGRYRPMSVHELQAGLARDGMPEAWWHRVAGMGSRGLLTQGIDDVPYAIPHKRIDLRRHQNGPVETGPWRSLARSQNGFVTECFLDEVGAAGGLDPLELRQRLLRERPRYRRVLELAAEKAGWGRTLQPNHHQGIAIVDNFGSVCAQVAEVSVALDGRVVIHRVVCAADCGLLVNPDLVASQMEGGILFGLSAALYGEITIAAGRVQQSNFHDYPVLRIGEAPEVDVHLVESDDPPNSVGETSTPVVAPAVANALFAATGVRARTLPLSRWTDAFREALSRRSGRSS